MITLYKKDNKGNIRVLNYWTEKHFFKQSSGLLNGQLIQNEKECRGKNIGKTNETSPEQQALLEMESKIREKLQEDYFRTVEEAQKNVVILPMLAKNFQDEVHKIDWNNCYIQPKLDGQRCLAMCTKEGSVTLISRDGIDIQKTHGSMQHIINDLTTIKEDVILDGELYIHSIKDNFQDVMKAIKKYREGISEKVEYHVYDMISDKPFRLRNIDKYIKNLSTCKKVPTLKIINKFDLEIRHIGNLAGGYEGSIIRWGEEGYKMNNRSSNLLKYKNFQDSDYLITDVVPADNRPDWGMVVCKCGDKTFPATPQMSHEERKNILLNKADYIGQTAVIKHFGFTDAGLPRFPIFKSIRLDNIKF